jgi:hypothetical protein
MEISFVGDDLRFSSYQFDRLDTRSNHGRLEVMLRAPNGTCLIVFRPSEVEALALAAASKPQSLARDLVRQGAASAAIALVALLALFVAPLAAQPLPYPKNGACAAGYRDSGGFCAPASPGACPAIPKPPGQQCPSGWRQSGQSCEMMECRR